MTTLSFTRTSVLAALGALLLAPAAGAQSKLLSMEGAPEVIGTRLPAPTSATASASGAAEVTVAWPEVPGAAKYRVTRAILPAAPVALGEATSTYVTDRTVQPGQRVAYWVTPVSPSGIAGFARRSNDVLLAGAASGGTVVTGGTTAGSGTATVESREQVVARAYFIGSQRFMRTNPKLPVDWQRLAATTSLGLEDLVTRFGQIHTVLFAAKYLLKRAATTEDLQQAFAVYDQGGTWETYWRAVAQSAEREQRFGYWAPAPIASKLEAQRAFGLTVVPEPEQCFGAIGDKCEGMPSIINSAAAPRWVDQFTLPDGTVMGMAQIGTAVGSILHDNACLADREHGLNCNGIGAGDLVKSADWPGAVEWNKASWNVLDSRFWIERFGPYPVNQEQHRSHWYDDLRVVDARDAWMAPVVSMFTLPIQTVHYTGKETRGTAALWAPARAQLDERDPAFCRSHSFAQKITIPLKSTYGVCS